MRYFSDILTHTLLLKLKFHKLEVVTIDTIKENKLKWNVPNSVADNRSRTNPMRPMHARQRWLSLCICDKVKFGASHSQYKSPSE